jgi:hypothetical protein
MPALLLSPVRTVGVPVEATAVVTYTRSPQTIGLECASPGIAVFQATLRIALASQLTGGAPAATPVPFAPRNAGQFCARAEPARSQAASASPTRVRADRIMCN